MIFATNSAVIYGWAEMLAPAYGELAQQFNIVTPPPALPRFPAHCRATVLSTANLVGHLSS
jgi:hypothetical protein